MHAPPSSAQLRFSVDKNALLTFLGVGFCALSIYLALSFPVTLDPAGSRRKVLTELLNAGDGWLGFLLFLMSAPLSGWWTVRAAWRFASDTPAARLRNGQLLLHGSFLAHKPIALAALTEAKVFEESRAPSIVTLRFRWRTPEGRHRRASIRSNTIVGGSAALAAFAAALKDSDA